MKKAIQICVNILTWLLFALAALFVFFTLSKKAETGLADIFGYSPMSVLSDSMEGDREDSFNQGDLIVVKRVKNRDELAKDQVVTFFDLIDGKRALNTHRIIDIRGEGEYTQYVTQGDNKIEPDDNAKVFDDIVGVYSFKMPGMGNVLDFMTSQWGIMCCLVIPLLLFTVWCAIKLVRTAISYSKAKDGEMTDDTADSADSAPALDAAELERLKLESEKMKAEAEQAMAELARMKAEKAAGEEPDMISAEEENQ